MIVLRADPEVLKKVLRRLRDNSDGYRFEGSIANGQIYGLYKTPSTISSKKRLRSNLVLVGSYNTTSGSLKINGRLNRMVGLLVLLPLAAVAISYVSLKDDPINAFRSTLAFGFFLFLGALNWLLFLLEKRRFKRYFGHILSEAKEG